MSVVLSSLLPSALRRPAMAAALCLSAAFGLAPTSAFAICNVDYVVQPGDNLFSIADKYYGDRNRWTLIYYRNQNQLAGPSAVPGHSLHIPCPPDEVQADATPLLQEKADLTLLTGSGYEPFTGKELPGGGMVTELVNAALKLAPSPVSYAITWENDWGKHLSPMVSDLEVDMGFPWAKPDCAADPTNARCVNFHFSEPIVSVPLIFFAKVGGDMTYRSDADVIGKTICVPAGFYSHDLDNPERRWVQDGKITLVQLNGPGACLNMVANGQADASLLNLFVGGETLLIEDLRDKVEPLEKPFSEITLHVVISKSLWRGTSHLYRVNAGLRKLRESGRFDATMGRHLELFWGKLR